MRIAAEEKKPTVSVEELLNLMQDKKEREPREPKRTGRAKTGFKGFPVATIMLGLLIVALGAMIIVLKSDIAVLKSDIADLKHFKTQAATLDAKQELSALEGRINEMKKDGEGLKGAMAQVRSDLEVVKTERKQGRK